MDSLLSMTILDSSSFEVDRYDVVYPQNVSPESVTWHSSSTAFDDPLNGLLVFDKQGIKRSFADFKREANQVYDTFNKNWLKTEFETSFAQSQTARKWLKIENEKETFPLLKYRTQLDDKVRDEHIELEGIIRPVNDAFWASFAPTNGYNCRCFLEQLAEGTITPVSELPEMRTLPDIDPIFMNNSGISGKVFYNKHPYFKVSKDDRDL